MTTPTSAADESLRSAAELVRAWGAIVIVGAGLSRPRGYPMSAQLLPLLWDALDADPTARAELTKNAATASATGKSIVGDDARLVECAFQIVAGHHVARSRFQAAFASLDQERRNEPSPAHDALAEMIHRGAASLVLSLNWDTALERAYERRYGHTLTVSADPLEKPHGDAADPESPWLLPFGTSQLHEHLLERVRSAGTKRPRILLIVGYSESDEDIVDSVIRPLDRRWVVIRIGPTADGGLAVRQPADLALPALVRLVWPEAEAAGWEYVTFEHQRDLGAALLGERLGAADVVACPSLPEVKDVLQRIRSSGQAVLIGPSGGGKSITAYQAAYELAQTGHEVLHLVDPTASPSAAVASLGILCHSTVLLLDDAQGLPPATIRAVRGLVRPGVAVIVVTTDTQIRTGSVVEMAEGRAVARLRSAFASKSPEIRLIIKRISGEKDIPSRWMDDRLADASRADTPWEFAFALMEGWRRAADDLSALRESNRADLALLSLAVGQIVTVDSGIVQQDLDRLGLALGRSEIWYRNALADLRRRRLLIGGDRLRTPHSQFAYLAFREALTESTGRDASAMRELLRVAVLGGASPPPIRGVRSLIEMSWFAGVNFLDASLTDRILDRCKASSDEDERGHAASLIASLLGSWHHEDMRPLNPDPSHAQNRLRSDPAWPIRWLQEVGSGSANGMSDLVKAPVAREIIAHGIESGEIRLEFLADRISAADAEASWPWRELLKALATFGPEAVGQLRSALPPARCAELIDRIGAFDVSQAYGLVLGLQEVHPELEHEFNAQLGHYIANTINVDPASGYRSAETFLLWELNFDELVGGPNDNQLRIGRGIAARIDPKRVAGAISASSDPQWGGIAGLLHWLGEADSRKLHAVVAMVDIDRLGKAITDSLRDPTDELESLLTFLAFQPDLEPVRGLLVRGAANISHLTPTLIALAPTVAAGRLAAGERVSLGVEDGGFNTASWALDELSKVDRQAVARLVTMNRREIAEGILTIMPTLMNDDSLDGVSELFRSLAEVAPGSLSEVLGEVDVDRFATNWADSFYNMGHWSDRAMPLPVLTRHDRWVLREIMSILEAEGSLGRILVEALSREMDDRRRLRRRLRRQATSTGK